MRWPLAAALLCLSAAEARADALPYDEDTERPVKSAVVVRGVDRFADHDVVLYPNSCPSALADLDMYGEDDSEWDEAVNRHGPVDFTVVKEGARLDWRRGENYCADSHLYAIPKGLLRELKAMTTAARQDFWRNDPRVLRTSYSLPYTTIAAPKRARLRAVEEVITILAIDGADMRVEIDSLRYRFAGGEEQTVPVHSVERPEHPNAPLTPAQLAAVAAAAVAETAATTGEDSATSTTGDDTTTSTTGVDATTSTAATDGATAIDTTTAAAAATTSATSTTALTADDAQPIGREVHPDAEKKPDAEVAEEPDDRGPLWLAIAAGVVALLAFAVARRRS
ncbi:MAG: hypothetical protein KC486_23205 [Myxococcales bacterium]|nr:hypothetical protein [Myxococcales bacterium]